MGSITLKHWLLNFQASFTQFDLAPECKCSVHQGMLNAVKSVIEEVSEALLEMKEKHPDASVAVTGHSLGGALASLAATALADRGFEPRLTTFGQPRVGDWKFVRYANSKLDYLRFVHAGDLVPTLPPTEFGYYHAGTEIWEHDGAFQICMNQGCEVPSELGLNAEDHRWYFDQCVGTTCAYCYTKEGVQIEMS